MHTRVKKIIPALFLHMRETLIKPLACKNDTTNSFYLSNLCSSHIHIPSVSVCVHVHVTNICGWYPFCPQSFINLVSSSLRNSFPWSLVTTSCGRSILSRISLYFVLLLNWENWIVSSHFFNDIEYFFFGHNINRALHGWKVISMQALSCGICMHPLLKVCTLHIGVDFVVTLWFVEEGLKCRDTIGLIYTSSK